MKQFISALMDAHLPAPDGLQDGMAHTAGRRFDVYRNNVVHSLITALKVGFPTVTRLLGPENMNRVAGAFLRAHPPTDPRMMYYGAAFPAFLESHKQLDQMGYLADVARLELAIRQAYHAGDAPAMPSEHLAEIPPEALLQTKVHLAPAVQVIRSDWPVLDIWNDAQTAQSKAQDVLITRPAFDPIPQALPPGGATWILALMQGAKLGDALDAATTEAPQFDMGGPLTLLLLGGALVSLE